MKTLLILFTLFQYSCFNSYKTFNSKEIDRSNHEAYSNDFLITSQGHATSRAAKKMIELGGNIVDAAIAASFTVSVERPQSTGIGGGGFLIFYKASEKKFYVYDFREVAPLKSHPNYFVDSDGKQIKEKSVTGAFAVAVPGLVRGMSRLHKDHGKLEFKKSLGPSINLARNGFEVYPELALAIDESKDRLALFSDSRKIFLKEKNKPLKAGDLLVQSDLAKTLERIANSYGEDFYTGLSAHKIISSVKAHGGDLSLKDMITYEVKMREPLRGSFKGHDIISMPPPSSGGAHIIQILNILEDDDLKSLGVQNSKTIHLTASAMQIAFRDRQRYMGDPDFVNVPTEKIISKSYAKDLREKIQLNRALSFKELNEDAPIHNEPEHTTHFTLMDGEGNIIVSTQTINGWFGSALIAEGTGVLLNNEMDDFAASDKGVNIFGALGGVNNLVQPRKRPLSSMSPTIVLKDGKPILALGSPNGTRILTCVANTILNYLEHDLSLWNSISASRYHHQWYPDEIRLDNPFLYTNAKKELQAMGHKVVENPYNCSIQAIAKKDNQIHGVSDMRGFGMALGL